MSKSYYDDVRDFNHKFGLPEDCGQPRILADTVFMYKYDHLQEEMHELLKAHRAGDLTAFADALADLVYVALGTALFAELPFHEIWTEVQRANMDKERCTGPDDPRGHRASADDVVKPEGCHACKLCIGACPEQALTLAKTG